MSDLVMVIERMNIQTGEMLDRTETTAHGWDSPESAVKHWRSLSSFAAHQNGRATRSEDTGIEVRAFFKVPAATTLFDLEPSDIREKAAA